ncbi:MAG: MaoC/PaaZ C-terminal domain-containing protein [Candidatus Zhuqueibacterota bacterium]
MTTIDWKLLTALLRNRNSQRMNRSMIGSTFESNLAPISHEEILRFARATRDENPGYGAANPVAPPFFLSKLIFPMIKDLWCHPALGLNILRAVYASQEIVWHQPIRPNDALKMVIEIIGITETPVGELLEISEIGWRSGQRIIEGKTGFIVRSKKSPEARRAEQAPAGNPLFSLDITTEDGQNLLFAEASGDHNFIHTSTLLAKLAGLPRTILHGACVAAMICAGLTKKLLDDDLNQLVSISGRFGKPTIPGDTLSLQAFESQGRTEIRFEVFNRAGQPVFKNGVFKFKR